MRRLLTGVPVRKPAGGVAEVVLTPVSNIRQVVFDAPGRCRFPVCADDTHCLNPPLTEGRSSFEEQSDGPPGAARITHTLTLALDPGDAAALTGGATAEAIRAQGAVALIRTESGRLLLCGFSARFGGEQPLHASGPAYASGCGLRERPLVLLRFRSTDTDPAAEIFDPDAQAGDDPAAEIFEPDAQAGDDPASRSAPTAPTQDGALRPASGTGIPAQPTNKAIRP